LVIPNLHRRFARTKLTPEAIRRFANQYGFLEMDEARTLTCPDGGIWKGEPLAFWKGEIRGMRRLLALADAVERRDERLLAPFVCWQAQPWKRVCLLLVLDNTADRVLLSDAARLVRQQCSAEDLARGFVLEQKHAPPDASIFWRLLADERPGVLSKNARPEPLRVWEYGDAVEPVRYFLYQEINAQLRGKVSPGLLPFSENPLQFFPNSLLSALYTQFLLELAGRTRPPILCANPHCGRHFEPTHGRQAFCDDKCRKAHHWRKNHPVPTRGSGGS